MLLAQRTIFNISLVAQLVKNPACNVGDLGLISGLGRSPGEGKGYPLQCSGPEISSDCIIHGVAKSWTRLSDFHFQPYSQLTYVNNLECVICIFLCVHLIKYKHM